MNLYEAVSRIFPDGIVQDNGRRGSDYFEVHELPRNAKPKNCEIVVSGLFQFDVAHECRNSYLVKTEKYVLLVRVLPDSPTTLYAEVTLMSKPQSLRPAMVH